MAVPAPEAPTGAAVADEIPGAAEHGIAVDADVMEMTGGVAFLITEVAE